MMIHNVKMRKFVIMDNVSNVPMIITVKRVKDATKINAGILVKLGMLARAKHQQ
jgi:hypothetical protein